MYYNNTSSIKLTITCGEPKGSTLGPLLFLLYSNDIANVSDILFSLLFTDDTSVFIQGDQLDDIASKMNIELNKLAAWLNANILSLNIDKTQYMIFRTSNIKLIKPTKLEMNYNAIKKYPLQHFLTLLLITNLIWLNILTKLNVKSLKW